MNLEDQKALSLHSQDIAALRAAETVQFSRNYDGESCLKLILSGTWDATAPRIYTARQQRLFPHTSTMSGDRYRTLTARSSVHAMLGGDTEHARCDHTLRRAQGNDEWQTITRMIKPGDVIGLRWRSDNDYQLITDVGLHRDELRMVLHRANNSPAFLIDAVVCANDRQHDQTLTPGLWTPSRTTTKTQRRSTSEAHVALTGATEKATVVPRGGWTVEVFGTGNVRVCTVDRADSHELTPHDRLCGLVTHPREETHVMSNDTAPVIEPVTVLHGHTSPETAHVVENYPYGSGLRCKKRYWVETATKGPKKGEQRLVTQTTNPKKPGEVWNNPHRGGYSMFVLLYRDGVGHVHPWHISMYSLYGAAEYRNHLSGVYDQLTDEQRKYYDKVATFSAKRNPTTYYEAAWTLAHVMNHIRDTGDDPQATNGFWITPCSQRVYLGSGDDPAVISAYARSLLGN